VAIEPLDHEHFGIAEGGDLGAVDRQTERLQKLQAVELVLDAVGQIDSIG
jgi:hypothetical protein